MDLTGVGAILIAVTKTLVGGRTVAVARGRGVVGRTVVVTVVVAVTVSVATTVGVSTGVSVTVSAADDVDVTGGDDAVAVARAVGVAKESDTAGVLQALNIAATTRENTNRVMSCCDLIGIRWLPC